MERVTIAVPHEEGAALFWLALQQGFFEREGLLVAPSEPDRRTQGMARLGDGTIPLLVAGDAALVLASFEKRDYRILSTFHIAKGKVNVAARRDHGIERPEDLRGKRVGLSRRAGRDFFLASFLLRFGLRSEDVLVVDKNPQELAGGHRQTVMQLLRALSRAEIFLHRQGEEALRGVRNECGIEESNLKDVWASGDSSLRLDQALLVRLENRARWVARQRGRLEVTPDYLDYMDPDPLQAVLPERIEIIH